MTPQWHDEPPCPGVYVVRAADYGRPCELAGNGFAMLRNDREVAEAIRGFWYYRWFGPIPEDGAAMVKHPPK